MANTLTLRLLEPDAPIDLLGDHLVASLRGEFAEDRKKCQRYTATACAVAVSALAKATFVSVSTRLGPGIGPVGAGANIACFFVLELWAARAMIEEVAGIRTEPQMALEGRHKDSRLFKVVVLGPSVFIAALSQLSPGLAASEYNAKHFKVPAAIILIAASSLFPARSIFLSVDAFRQRAKNDFERQLATLKSVIATRIGEAANRLKGSDRQAFVEQLTAASQSDQPLVAYASLLLEEVPTSVEEPAARRHLRLAAQGLGMLITAGLQFSLADYAHAQSKKQIADNEPLAVALAVTSCLSSAYLTGQSIANTTARIATSCYDLVTGHRKPTLSQQLRPKLSLALNLGSMTIDALAMGAVFVIWKDYYTKEGERDYFIANNIAGYFMLLFTAMLDTTDEMIRLQIARSGSQEEQELVRLYQQLNQISQLIQKSHFTDFSIFVLNLPETTRQRLIDRVKLTVEQLQSYVGASRS